MKKNLFKFISFALLICAQFVFTACQKSEDPYLSVTGNVSIDEKGDVNGDIIVDAKHTDWSVDVTKGRDWLTCFKNGNKVGLTAKENNGTSSREATIVVKATVNANLYQEIKIVQKGSAPIITVNGTNSTEVVFEGKSGIAYKQTIKVVSNVAWSCAGIPDWISVSPSNGDGTVDMTIYPIKDNESSSNRTARISITGSGASASISVTQSAGKPTSKVEAINEVALHDAVCFEYSKTGNVNTFQYILLSEREYNRMTDNELTNELKKQEECKFVDEYISMLGYDSHDVKIVSNSVYYLVTLARDANDAYGELVKKKIITPVYRNEDDDAWVNFDNIYSNISKGFWFDTIKEGYCNTYHLIYGIIPQSYSYNRVLYAFQINYWLKYKKKHWYASNWDMQIVTDYPNNHTFMYSTTLLSAYPRCFAYGWGVFKDGKISSDLVGFQWDTSEDSKLRMPSAVIKNNNPENVMIRRSVEEARARSMRK